MYLWMHVLKRSVTRSVKAVLQKSTIHVSSRRKKKRQTETVSVRSRFAGDEGVKPIAEFVEQICKEIRTKEIRKEEVQEQK